MPRHPSPPLCLHSYQLACICEFLAASIGSNSGAAVRFALILPDDARINAGFLGGLTPKEAISEALASFHMIAAMEDAAEGIERPPSLPPAGVRRRGRPH